MSIEFFSPLRLSCFVIGRWKLLSGFWITLGEQPSLLKTISIVSRIGAVWGEFLGLDRPHVKRAILFGAVVAILVLPIVLTFNMLSADLLEKALGAKPEPQPTIKVLQTSISLGERICFGIAAILFAPVVEEALFRGIFYPFIKQRGYPRLALFLTSLVFGAFHGSLVTLVPLTLLAMVLVFVYEKTDKLIAPMITHAFFNSVNFFTFIYQDQVERWLHHFSGT